MTYLKAFDIKLNGLFDSTRDYLKKNFGNNSLKLDYSRPEGQILLVIMNITKIVKFYLKDVSKQTNILTADRDHTVMGLAALVGHNAYRGEGSKGIVKFVKKQDVTSAGTPQEVIIIPNNFRLVCMNNNLEYYVSINGEFIKTNLNNQTKFSIIQGKRNVKTFQSNGGNLQTYSVPIAANDNIDNEQIQVYVNGVKFSKNTTLYDNMLKEKTVLVKTGISGGVDVTFGNERSHTIPGLGSKIEIIYFTHEGILGNEAEPLFRFKDSAYGLDGSIVDLNSLFYVQYLEGGLLFGSNPEGIELTRMLAPINNSHSIIHDKKSLTYELTKMNMFGAVMVEVEEEFLVATLFPRISEIISNDEDYFNFDINKLLINPQTISRLKDKIEIKQSNSVEVELINPKIVKYGINLVIELRENPIFDSISFLKDVRKVISEYNLSLTRTNKAHISDIIRIIDSMEEVDSLTGEFIVGDDSHLDNLKNIKLFNNQLAVMRGGFVNSLGQNVSDEFNGQTLSSVHIELVIP